MRPGTVVGGKYRLERRLGSGGMGEVDTALAYAKVLDFGISKFSTPVDSMGTGSGSMLGSPRCMSPEQAQRAADADQRADIWAAGVVLFRGLTGTFPHDGDSFSSILVAIIMRPPRLRRRGRACLRGRR